MAKEYRMQVRGWVSRRETPADAMKDMLRYDEGTIESVESVPGGHTFIAVVRCKAYTPERWESFMLRTKLIERV